MITTVSHKNVLMLWLKTDNFLSQHNVLHLDLHQAFLCLNIMTSEMKYALYTWVWQLFWQQQSCVFMWAKWQSVLRLSGEM